MSEISLSRNGCSNHYLFSHRLNLKLDLPGDKIPENVQRAVSGCCRKPHHQFKPNFNPFLRAKSRQTPSRAKCSLKIHWQRDTRASCWATGKIIWFLNVKFGPQEPGLISLDWSYSEIFDSWVDWPLKACYWINYSIVQHLQMTCFNYVCKSGSIISAESSQMTHLKCDMATVISADAPLWSSY